MAPRASRGGRGQVHLDEYIFGADLTDFAFMERYVREYYPTYQKVADRGRFEMHEGVLHYHHGQHCLAVVEGNTMTLAKVLWGARKARHYLSIAAARDGLAIKTYPSYFACPFIAVPTRSENNESTK